MRTRTGDGLREPWRKVRGKGIREPSLCPSWSAAAWFWTKNSINDVIANGGSVKAVTRIVNGGYNQLDERTSAYYRFLEILGG